MAINQACRKYLRFLVNQINYQFAVLSLGLSAAPRVFTKVMVAVAAFLRLGVQIYSYLDDWFVKCWSKLQYNIDWVAVSRHWMFNQCRKLSPLPVQRIEFIGAVLDLSEARAFLPYSWFQTIWSFGIGMKAHLISQAWNCLRLLGYMALCTYVV